MPSINKNAPHPDKTDVPDEATRVAPHEGHEHGYWGASPDTRDRADYTVAGVTQGGRNPGPTEHVPESPRQGDAGAQDDDSGRHASSSRSSRAARPEKGGEK